jgi:hypothetical protein
MGSLVGFTLRARLVEKRQVAAQAAQERALSHFPHLQTWSVKIGETCLDVWGHKTAHDRLYTLPDGSLLALIGSPVGKVDWPVLAASLQDPSQAEAFTLPWDGRVILLHISADGKRWTLWNDWLGSMPVYYTQVDEGRIASTLEPVPVACAQYSSVDFFLPGLVSLLINGHYLSDWTLYKALRTVPPDCIAKWDTTGFQYRSLWTVTPSEKRWDVSWDDLVDEMYEYSWQAIADVLRTRSTWILPLSAGLDSRLIAGVAARLKSDVHAYAWGEPNSTDVVFSRQIAKTLRIPWKHINLPDDFLSQYTPIWADVFGSAMHFHGMYQMAFLDVIKQEATGALLSGFIGDVLSGSSLMQYDKGSVVYKKEWYKHWTTREVRTLLKFPIDDALNEIAAEVAKQSRQLKGSQLPRSLLFELWSRQRFFTSFQSTLSDHALRVATPFINRQYARFCLSLPRIALENRRLLGDVFRRHYGMLAVIPGTYADEPFIRTGQYLLKHRIASHLPHALRIGPFAGYDQIPLRMDVDSLQATGKEALWPLFQQWDRLTDWLDVAQVEAAYQAVMHSAEDIRPLRKLQSIQTLAYRL